MKDLRPEEEVELIEMQVPIGLSPSRYLADIRNCG